QFAQIFAGTGAWGLLTGNTASHEGLVELVVQVGAVRHQQKRELPRNRAAYFFGEERHRIGFPASLRVPEHPEFSQIGMRRFHQFQRLVISLPQRLGGRPGPRPPPWSALLFFPPPPPPLHSPPHQPLP